MGVLAHHPAKRQRRGEEGMALVIAVFFTMFGLGLILSGSLAMTASEKRTNVNFRHDTQARQFAEAGLIDALAWYRRQTTQPVTSFDPRLDTAANPPVLDTIDPTIGIVREFEISGNVWGRYEVRKWEPGVNPPVPEVADVSAQRGAGASGTVWRLVSRGFVYNRRDPSQPYNVKPNSVLSRDIVETEVRRMMLAPPAQAALCVSRADRCRILSRGRIRGGNSTGCAWPNNTGSPTLSGEVTGSPPTAGLSSYDDSVTAVFGVSEDQLRSLADDRVTSSTDFPNPVPENQIVFCESSVVFNAARPLRGTGIVFVDGNVTIDVGSNSFFNGLLYVTGNLTVRAPALMRGAVIVRGTAEFSGIGDYSELEYDDGVLQTLMRESGQYRISRSIRETRLRGSLKQ